MENLSLKENKPSQLEIKHLPHVSYVETEKAVYCFKQPNFNSHDYVDLGLPSGTIWATKNVGATTIMESGNFYMWGSTTPNNDTYCD